MSSMLSGAIIALAALTCSGSWTMAQTRVHRYADPYDGRYGGPRYEEPFYCAAQCPADTSPCDPWYFKQADGRCTGDNRRK